MADLGSVKVSGYKFHLHSSEILYCFLSRMRKLLVKDSHYILAYLISPALLQGEARKFCFSSHVRIADELKKKLCIWIWCLKGLKGSGMLLDIVWSEWEKEGRKGRKERQMHLSILHAVHTLHEERHLNSNKQVYLMGSAEQNLMSLFSFIRF